jgi:dephospho-CoA kinase
MLAIGLTGGIGTGKSSVSAILRELGVVFIDADQVGWETYRKDSPGFDAITVVFGDGVVADDGEIDRKALGQIVFSDSNRMSELTSIVWPLIGESVKEQLNRNREQGAAVTVVEAAVLFEAQWESMFDEVWVVTTPREAVESRLIERDGISAAEIEARISSQMMEEDRVQRGDVIINNYGDLKHLRSTVENMWCERTAGRRS